MVRVGKRSDIPEGEGRVFRISQNEIAVFRLASESRGDPPGRPYTNHGILEPSSIIVAIDNRCPHQAGPLADGIITGDLVVCPLHGHKFNLITGESLDGIGRVKTYKVLVDGEDLFIEDHEIPPS